MSLPHSQNLLNMFANSLSLSNPAFLASISSLSDDTSLSDFSMEIYYSGPEYGTGVIPLTDGGSINLDYYAEGAILGSNVDEFDVIATPTHPAASVGTMTLTPSTAIIGDNLLEFDVTAENGSMQNYSVTFHVRDTGLPEITEITAQASIHGAYITLYKRIPGFGEVARAFVLNGGPKVSITSWNFSGLTGANFVTEDTGKYLIIGSPTTTYAVWFNTGTETAPILGGGETLVEISINHEAPATAITAAFVSAMFSYGFTNSSSYNETAELWAPTTGATATPNIAAMPSMILGVTQNGRSNAGEIPGVTSIIVEAPDGMATEMATRNALIDAINAEEGWLAEAIGTSLGFTVTDNVAESRTDAVNNGAVASLNITQQGRGPE